MADKVYVSVNGDVAEVVMGKPYPKDALFFFSIEKSPTDYRRQKDKAYEEVSASIEKMMEKISRRTAHI
jgi:hypothetical protein